MHSYFFILDYRSLEDELLSVIQKPMSELCFHWNDDTHDCALRFTCCPTIKTCTVPILSPLYLFSTNGRTDIFRYAWKENLSSLKSRRNCAFTQENIVNFVWKPTVAFCMDLITRLKDGRISLSEVEQVFCSDESLTDLQSSCESLVKSLVSSKQLTYKFCRCRSCTKSKIQQHFSSVTFRSMKISLDLSWIEKVRKQIEHYRLSKKCIECAKMLLTLCDQNHLNLDTSAGDYNSLLVLGQKVKIILYNYHNS